MAITYTFSTAATRSGARDLNRIHRAVAQDDVGYKLQFLISAVNILESAVSALVLGAVAAAGSAVTWSSFSGFTLSTMGQLSNFRS